LSRSCRGLDGLGYFSLLCGEILIRVIGQQLPESGRVQRRCALWTYWPKVGFVPLPASIFMAFELIAFIDFPKSFALAIQLLVCSSNWELVCFQLDCCCSARLTPFSARLALSNSS